MHSRWLLSYFTSVKAIDDNKDFVTIWLNIWSLGESCDDECKEASVTLESFQNHRKMYEESSLKGYIPVNGTQGTWCMF